MKGFITGTHYNRCKRLHQMVAAAFETLHFESFLLPIDKPSKDVIHQILTASGDLSTISSPLKQLLEDY